MRRAPLVKLLIHLVLVEVTYAVSGHGFAPSSLPTSSASSASTTSAGGLKRVRVNLPQYRRPGEAAQLHCDYDLGNDTLYAVKWYKDDEEFYRFVARERPQATSHRVDGVRVAVSQSDSRRVILPAVDLRTGGVYRCEVSAEAPSFASAQSEARMDVISSPSEDPAISGVSPQYQIGDSVDLNCTSGRSFPATTLVWYINEQRVSGDNALTNYPPRQHKDGLITSVLGLRFPLRARHFDGGSMRVKCVAFVYPAAVEDLREALLLVKNDGQSTVPVSPALLIVVFFGIRLGAIFHHV